MYMTPLNYTNFAGAKKSTKLHFHLTPREFTDWMVDNKDEADKLLRAFTSMQEDMEAQPDGDATESQKLSMLRLVRVLAELSYGQPSDDGEVFDKSETKKFTYSAAYDAFRLRLFENPKELLTFIQTLLNEEVMKDFSARISALAQEEGKAEAKTLPYSPKDPKDMTHEELLAAFKARNRE